MNEDDSKTVSNASGLCLSRTAVRCLLLALLGGAAIFLGIELFRGPSPVWAQASTAGRAGRFLAVAGQITGDTYGLYLVDLETGIITMYQWVPGPRRTGTLRFLAGRNTTYDLQMDEYNTEPSPREIQKLVGQTRRIENTPPR